MSLTRRAIVAVLVCAAAMTMTACGDDESARSGDEREITELLTRFENEQRDDVLCARYVTTRLVEDIFGSLEGCRRHAQEGEEDDEDAEDGELEVTGVRVTNVSIDGDTATARMEAKLEGIGYGGELTVLRLPAGWRVDELSADYLRTGLLSSSKARLLDLGIDRRKFREAGIDGCLARKLPRSDAMMQSFGYQVIGERNDADLTFRRDLARCLADERSGREALRALFEQGFRDEDRLTGPLAECIIRRLRRTVTSREIARYFVDVLSSRDELEPPPSITRRAKNATLSCRRDEPQSAPTQPEPQRPGSPSRPGLPKRDTELLFSADLAPRDGDGEARAAAFILREDGQTGLFIRGQRLPPTSDTLAYGVWLRKADAGDQRFLGFIHAPVDETGTLRSISQLPGSIEGVRTILLTLETSREDPPRPHEVVLAGRLRKPTAAEQKAVQGGAGVTS